MKKLEEATKQNILALTISSFFLVFFWFFFSHFAYVSDFFAGIGKALTPFLFGLVIAFIAIPIRRIAENKWMAGLKWKARTKRKVAVAIAIVIFLLIIASFFIVLIPQLSDSVTMLTKNMGSYLKTASGYISQLSQNSELSEAFSSLYDQLQTALNKFVSGTAGLLASIVSYSVSVVSGIVNFMIGVVIAIYLMTDQEKFKLQIKHVLYAVLPEKVSDRVLSVGRLTSHMLYSFIFGKALDSLIIGILCWICTAIMGLPYATLISFVVGITNMIPVFGPFIGALPCIFILLIIEPIAAVEFGIFILILQQIDGNILGPYILGDSMGLSPIWIMFAILVGGSMFGVLGMFLGVPIFSVIYVLISRRVQDRLKKKNISIEQ